MRYNSTIDGIKGIAVILIACIYHYGILFCGKYTTGYEGYATEWMFIISGYLAYNAYYSRVTSAILDFKSFFGGRVKRLGLGLIVSTVVMEIGQIIYLYAYGEMWHSANNDLFHFVSACLGVHLWIDSTPAVNGPTWYISVLLFVYIIFYITTIVSKRWGRGIYVLPIFIGVFITDVGMNYPLINNWMGRGFYAFFVGVILAIIFQKDVFQRWICKNKYMRYLVYIMALGIVYVFVKLNMLGDVSKALTFFAYPILMVFVVYERLAEYVLGNRIMKFLGRISFGIYIWNQPMELYLILFDKGLGLEINYAEPKIFILHLCLNVILGWIWYFVERRVERNGIKTECRQL